jgi:hypothetical protein
MSEPASEKPAARAVPTTGEHRVVAPPGGRILRWDLPVVAVALILLAAGWRIHASLTRTRMAIFQASGLVMAYPGDMGLRDPPVVPAEPSLRVSLWKPGDASRGILVQIDRRAPMLGSVAAGLELERAQRLGVSYVRLETGTRSLGKRDFLRTRFRYVASVDGPPGPIWAVEYAWPVDPATSSPYLYRVTVLGSEAGVAALEATVLTTVSIEERE